jgi:hypothetical protein
MSPPATSIERELGTVLLSSIIRLKSLLFPILRTPLPKANEGIILKNHYTALAALRVEDITLRRKKTKGTIPP